MANTLNPVRNSRMDLEQVYFWTNTIKDGNHLLKDDFYKEIIINQLLWLVNKNLVKIYGFVIMPNHMHLIWQLLSMNGKEKPHASFNKWTSSNFLKNLRTNNPERLMHFVEETMERNHRFWQKDPLAILLDSKKKFQQKLDYLHLNPLQEHWNLAKSPEQYRWSSAGYYYTGKDEFSISTHYMELF